jgi:hypothetical protein
MIKNAVLNGFVKRCAQYGLGKNEISGLLQKIAGPGGPQRSAAFNPEDEYAKYKKMQDLTGSETYEEPVDTTPKEVSDLANKLYGEGKYSLSGHKLNEQGQPFAGPDSSNAPLWGAGIGGALGAAGGGAAGYISGETPEQKRNRAIYGALLGAPVGGLAGYGIGSLV